MPFAWCVNIGGKDIVENTHLCSSLLKLNKGHNCLKMFLNITEYLSTKKRKKGKYNEEGCWGVC